MSKIRVAIIGVGNCASSFVQGIHRYSEAPSDEFVPGLMHTEMGGYHIGDIEVVAAFDIDQEKVGKDVAEAIFSGQNNTVKFTDVPTTGVVVQRGMTHDGLGKYLSQVITKAPGPTVDIVKILREREVDVVINYLPVGSEEATKWYVEQVLAAKVGLVNCIPVFIAREPYWQKRFEDAGVPIVGDDIKSQVGATITHRVLTNLFRERGVKIERTYQLNFGGNTDFMNMLERERLESKKESKTNAVTSQLPYDLGPGQRARGPQRLRAVVAGPEVVPHQNRGADLRRRPVEPRAEAGSLGQPQLGGRRRRCRAEHQAGHEPRGVGPTRRPERLLHEVPRPPASRRHRSRHGRGLHPRLGIVRSWPGSGSERFGVTE